MKLTPASSARWTMRTHSSWSGLPHLPNIIAPRQCSLTWTPVLPRLCIFMRLSPRSRYAEPTRRSEMQIPAGHRRELPRDDGVEALAQHAGSGVARRDVEEAAPHGVEHQAGDVVRRASRNRGQGP